MQFVIVGFPLEVSIRTCFGNPIVIENVLEKLGSSFHVVRVRVHVSCSLDVLFRSHVYDPSV